MKILRNCYLGAGLFSLVVLVAWCGQEVLPHAACGFGNPFEVLEQSRREDQRGRELDGERRALWRHIEIKSALVRELVAGRRSLWEVVRLLREQGAVTPLYLMQVRALYPGVRDDEAVGRNVIHFAAGFLDDPSTQAAVLARLEVELARGPVP